VYTYIYIYINIGLSTGPLRWATKSLADFITSKNILASTGNDRNGENTVNNQRAAQIPVNTGMDIYIYMYVYMYIVYMYVYTYIWMWYICLYIHVYICRY
jgi:hypothetical protein